MTTTYRIKIFCSFASSEICKNNFEKIDFADQIDFYGENKKVFFTTGDDYTHAILINTPMPDLKIPKANVIGLAFEPIHFLGLTPQFIQYAQTHIGRYYIGDKYDLPLPFVEGFAYMWHSRPPKEITLKKKIMSIILSNKRMAPGHIYRHQLVEEIIKRRLPIDIFGRGSVQYNYPTVKGEFECDSEAFEDYLYSICIENFKCNHYFSEKIMNPLLLNCVPLYYGCHNISEYFDDVLIITGDLNRDMELIINIFKNPYGYYKPMYNAKNLKTVNLIENMEKVFSFSDSLSNSLPKNS